MPRTKAGPTLVKVNANTVAAWLEFIREHAPRQFPKWFDGQVADWLVWQAQHNLVTTVRTGPLIRGFGVAWRCDYMDLGKAWVCDQPTSGCGWIELVIATDRPAFLGVLRGLKAAAPNWRQLDLYARREGEVRCLRRWQAGKDHQDGYDRKDLKPETRNPKPETGGHRGKQS